MRAAGGARVGVDVGGTTTRVLVQGAGRRRAEVGSAPTPDTYDALLALIARLVADAGEQAIGGAGCGVPGTAGSGGVGFVPALPFLEGRDLAADLAGVLRAPVAVANDAQLALLGEAREGAARGRRSAVLVSVGTGIGGAIMVEGRVFPGAHGSAGSWGWLPAAGAAPDEVHGELEQVASGTALSRQAAALESALTAAELVEAARRHDHRAERAVAAYAARLGRGIAAIASVIDPEIVLVGGGLSEAMDVIGPAIAESCRRFASPDGRKVPVVRASLGPSAGVVGALWLAPGQGGRRAGPGATENTTQAAVGRSEGQ